MSLEIQIPFQLTSAGTVATLEDPDVQVLQHVRSLVKTRPGERVMLPTYGINLDQYVFEPGVDLEMADMLIQTRRAFQTWEPNINLINLIPVGDEEDGVIDLEIDFARISDLPVPSTRTALVRVGGEVVEENP